MPNTSVRGMGEDTTKRPLRGKARVDFSVLRVCHTFSSLAREN